MDACHQYPKHMNNALRWKMVAGRANILNTINVCLYDDRKTMYLNNDDQCMHIALMLTNDNNEIREWWKVRMALESKE